MGIEFYHKSIDIFCKVVKFCLNLFEGDFSMIKLIGKLIINHVKKISARNQYFTNTIYSCFYSVLNNKYDNIGAQ